MWLLERRSEGTHEEADNKNSREESKGQDLEIKKLTSVEAKVDLPINLSNALNSNLERLASEGI